MKNNLILILFIILYFNKCSSYTFDSGIILFGGKFQTKYNYYVDGPKNTITLLGMDIYDYTSALSAPFRMENSLDQNNPIGIITPGFCFTSQQPIQLMIYYYANKSFYLHLLPKQNCTQFHVLSLTIDFVAQEKKY
ncbi:hypothetical protein ACTFIZ_009628 [Dictyostelium cf. discoideum]